MAEVGADVLNSALRQGPSGWLPVTAGIDDDGSDDGGHSQMYHDDSLHS